MKKRVQTQNAPKAVGPYSQAMIAGGFVYTAGQVAIDPATGKLIEGDIAAQTKQVMRNLNAVLEAAGVNFAHVVKATLYLADINDFSAVNEVYATYFPNDPPARSAVGVAALPLGARVEIEMIAYL